VSRLHLTNIETACREYIKILSGSYINPHKSYIRPKWVNDLSPICDLYLGLIFPAHISHLAHIGNTYPSYTEFLSGTNFPCLVGGSLKGLPKPYAYGHLPLHSKLFGRTERHTFYHGAHGVVVQNAMRSACKRHKQNTCFKRM
jgi:hypothetical protein